VPRRRHEGRFDRRGLGTVHPGDLDVPNGHEGRVPQEHPPPGQQPQRNQEAEQRRAQTPSPGDESVQDAAAAKQEANAAE
jgi:hypothetical protein